MGKLLRKLETNLNPELCEEWLREQFAKKFPAATISTAKVAVSAAQAGAGKVDTVTQKHIGRYGT